MAKYGQNWNSYLSGEPTKHQTFKDIKDKGLIDVIATNYAAGKFLTNENGDKINNFRQQIIHAVLYPVYQS